ncbi:flagellar hook capping FlgD N-terminal domain-containing protein [Clostridium sp. AL.422]|uniref:flagellar hook capping FlgD N-terminal domain-containing protein n=1 Tax=Clostridium TaxID=1485 RepID=UPI00293DADAA|nr:MULTISPECIES: flagellar hook capping FlgD N-terminal domain-containing protein [unclassified Clostridium]MDV4149700.1 flagellar hook capping FlgD N-terminal domain-containing protein [Clostridium sp. AL.422]
MANAINTYTGARATDRGTRIVKSGEDMDKNAFLTILSAELSNMDPMGNNDSTQYVTQMAQFASMEQMTNLNNTMSGYANNSMVGKGVTLKSVNSEGVNYTGIVKSVTTNSSKTTISVEINENGTNTYKDFDLKDVLTVLDVPDYSIPAINNINGNMSFLVASSFIGKHIELNQKDATDKNITGEVLGVVKDQGIVKVRVKLHDSDEIQEFTYDKIIKASNSKEEIKPEQTDV